MKNGKVRWKSWGYSISPHLKESADFACPHCDEYSLMEKGESISRTMIGFSTKKELIASTRRMSRVVGAFIVECPKCFKQFIVHASNDDLRCYERAILCDFHYGKMSDGRKERLSGLLEQIKETK